MDNSKLIQAVRAILVGEHELDQSEWIDMVESLANALENSDKENAALRKIISGFRKFNGALPFSITDYFDAETLELYFKYIRK